MKERFDELFSSDLEFEELRNGDAEISDSDFIFCTVEDCLAHDDGLAIDRAKYIVRAVNLHREVCKHLEQDIRILKQQAKDYVIGSYELRSIDLRVQTKQELLAKARGGL